MSKLNKDDFHLLYLMYRFKHAYKKLYKYHDDKTLKGFVDFACDSVLNGSSDIKGWEVIEPSYYMDDKYKKIYYKFFESLYNLLFKLPSEKIESIKNMGCEL